MLGCGVGLIAVSPPKSTAVTGRRGVTPLEMGLLETVPDIGRPMDWVRWKDMLDIVEVRVPSVLCEDVKDMRDCFLLGEGVRRRPEEWVLLFDRVDWVA